MTSPAVLPGWVVPDADEVSGCHRAAGWLLDRLGRDQRHLGVLGALHWLTIGEVSPMTARAGPATRVLARADSWVALCVAAGMPPPTERDWQWLEVGSRTPVIDDREWSYGVWRTLWWLLGVHEDWPTQTSRCRAAAIPPELPHPSAARSARDSDAWQAADWAARDQAHADALLHWQQVRRLADRTGSG